LSIRDEGYSRNVSCTLNFYVFITSIIKLVFAPEDDFQNNIIFSFRDKIINIEGS
jgi:hypothetical protein